MKFFIDTGNLAQIKEAYDLGILDGVTTNPSLMAKEGITGHDNIMKHYVDICNIVDGDVSAEVIVTNVQGQTIMTSAMNNGSLQINTADWSEGMYMVSVKSAQSTFNTKMVVKH